MAEVLAGQWERHSDFFYQHRIEAMQAKLARSPDDLAAMDNLAVAYEKLGDFDHAIAVMLDKEKRFPNQYTTASNLGTFYMLRGDLDQGIELIQKALAINPNAHFGREKCQMMLAEYLRDAKNDPTVLERGTFVWPLLVDEQKFSPATQPRDRIEQIQWALEIQRKRGNLKNNADVDAAITGVVGMIRFGTWTNGHLYAALGDLLAARNDSFLAYRAYQRALEFNYPRPNDLNEWMRESTGRKPIQRAIDADMIAAERAAADQWVAAYQHFEDDLIRAGKDADSEANLAPFYARHGRSLASSDWFFADYQPRWTPEWISASVVTPLMGMWLFSLYRRDKRQRAARA